MGSERTKVDNTTWGKNGSGWLWMAFGLVVIAYFANLIFRLDHPVVLAAPIGVSLGMALRIVRSLKQEIADLKSGDADVSTAPQDSE